MSNLKIFSHTSNIEQLSNIELDKSSGMSIWSLGAFLYGPNLVPNRFFLNVQSRCLSVWHCTNDVVDWFEKLYNFHVQDKLWLLGVGYNFSILLPEDCTNVLLKTIRGFGHMSRSGHMSNCTGRSRYKTVSGLGACAQIWFWCAQKSGHITKYCKYRHKSGHSTRLGTVYVPVQDPVESCTDRYSTRPWAARALH